MRISTCFKAGLLLAFWFTGSIFAGHPIRTKNGMVVSASPLATDVGVEILRKGGNAIDAAVATGFALAVTYPTAGNIGGGGFMVIHLADGRNVTFDFRETAPASAHEKMYLDSLGNYNPDLSQKGWLSAGVPGTVAGLIDALEKYGTMSLKQVIEPAINLAENGFILSYEMAESINQYYDEFVTIPSSEKIFTNNGFKFFEGNLFVQKDLANTLKLIRDGGKEAFYRGEVARKFVEESKLNGGVFELSDLINYKSLEREPIIGTYRGYKIVSMGPPSSGGICLVEALNILENKEFSKEEWGSSSYIHLLAETLKRVYADRSEYLGDPAFYNVPTEKLISKDYAKWLFSSITDEATPSDKIGPALNNFYESDQTTHFSVADSFGNAVSTTVTINSAYGNRIVVEGLGFLLNNEMDDFSAKPGEPNQFGLIGSMANSIEPAKRMLSSMTPTILLKDEKPFLILGSPGGSTIITMVLQVIQNVIDFGMNIRDAVDAPRIHHQWLPDEIFFEEYGVSEDVKSNLKKRGHTIKTPKSLGRIEAIMIDPNERIFYGISDTRDFGKAAGF